MKIIDTRGTSDKYKRKSLAKGNQLYKGTPYKRESLTYTRKPLTCGNSCKMQCLRKDNPPFSNGNPLYKEIPDTGDYFVQGEPLVNIRGNRLQMGINYIRKPLIYGKFPTRVK